MSTWGAASEIIVGGSMYTPGPWTTDGGLVKNSNGKCIFEYDSSIDMPGDPYLISAAPELLEALKSVPALKTDNPEWIKFYELANKAIQKAEGR